MTKKFSRNCNRKKEKIKEIDGPEYQEIFVEFLYLNKPDKGCKWGMNAMANGPFIQEAPRNVF